MFKRDWITLFSLFHHDINVSNNTVTYDTSYLYRLSQKINYRIEIKDLANSILRLVETHTDGLRNSDISLTLTGGSDSRVILAALMRIGIKPTCFTYGNHQSKDVIYSKYIAQVLGLDFYNSASEEPDAKWYYDWVISTIHRGEGRAHLHRAHRTAAIAEFADKVKPKVIFTGHMGGEGIRGLIYNDYFSSKFFELVNEKKADPLDAAKKVLDQYFIRAETYDINKLLLEVKKLPWMGKDKEVNKFFFLYDLIGKVHHPQDLRIFQTYVPNVVPVFLQSGYLDTLFCSKYSCLAQRLGFTKNPYIYYKLIEYLYPELLSFQLVNNYSPKEYNNGFWYYIPVKAYRKIKTRNMYPPSFSYGKWFHDFILSNIPDDNSKIWEYYNKKHYVNEFERGNHLSSEGYWHKFSNPVFFEMLMKYKEGKI